MRQSRNIETEEQRRLRLEAEAIAQSLEAEGVQEAKEKKASKGKKN